MTNEEKLGLKVGNGESQLEMRGVGKVERRRRGVVLLLPCQGVERVDLVVDVETLVEVRGRLQVVRRAGNWVRRT